MRALTSEDGEILGRIWTKLIPNETKFITVPKGTVAGQKIENNYFL